MCLLANEPEVGLERIEEAVSLYREAIDQAPADYNLWSNLAAGLRQLPETGPEVRDACSRAIELGNDELTVNPDDAVVLSRIASCHAVLGDIEFARAATQRAVSLSPEETNVLFNAAVALVDTGDLEEAAAMIEQAIATGYLRHHVEVNPELEPLLPYLD